MNILRLIFAYILMMTGVLVALLGGACAMSGVWPMLIVMAAGVVIIAAGWAMRSPKVDNYSAEPASPLRRKVLALVLMIFGALVEVGTGALLASVLNPQYSDHLLALFFGLVLGGAGGYAVWTGWKILRPEDKQ